MRVFDYNLWARYDQGFQATPWPMAERLGLPDVPSEYGVENGLEVLAQAVRAEVRQRSFCAIVMSKRSLYQDRLGTNIGKTQKESGVFL